MPNQTIDAWYTLLCQSRRRMGIEAPPFRWRYLLRWWGWNFYILGRVRRLLKRTR